MNQREQQDELHARMRSECSGEGQSFVVYVLHAVHDLADRLYADQSKPGTLVMAAIINWATSTEAGRKERLIPICTCCDVPVGKGTVGGWIIMIPTDPKAIAVTGAFCIACARLDQHKLTEKIVQSIRDEYNAEVEVHTIQ